jgi:hypothetical protein
MKTLFIFGLFSLLLTGCEAPQRGRIPANYVTGEKFNSGNGFQSSTTSGTTSGVTTGTTAGGTPAPNSDNALNMPGFEKCDLNPQKNHASGIGYMGICQSSQDETLVAVKPTITNQDERTCLIPTYKETSGSSTYIGQPQCFLTMENQVVTGKLFKTRGGFQHYPINGAMIMKETSLGAYFKCMDAYATYRSPACPYGPKTNAGCEQYARAYMDQLCQSFKAMNAYIDARLK